MIWPQSRFQSMRPQEVADLIERFVSGQSERNEWDDFISVALDDPALDQIRIAAGTIPERYPPDEPRTYCSDEGARHLLELANAARELPDRTLG
ncbi:MAG TPA: hypothetical protein VF824_08515 [Thermoanaerobaculia bacterium]